MNDEDCDSSLGWASVGDDEAFFDARFLRGEAERGEVGEDGSSVVDEAFFDARFLRGALVVSVHRPLTGET